MSSSIHRYFYFVLALILTGWQPVQVCAQEIAPETEADDSMSAERMLEAAVVDLKDAMREALRKNAQIGEKNDALRQELIQNEKELTALQEEKATLAEDQKVLREALRLQDEDREALRKKMATLREQEENHDGNQAEKELQMSTMLEKQKRLREEAQLLEEEVAFFQKRRQQKSVQSLLRGREQEKESLESQMAVLRGNIDKKKEDVLHMQQKISSQKERTEKLREQKEQWLQKLAGLQTRLKEVEETAAALHDQGEKSELRAAAALNELEGDIAQLQNYKEQLERAFAEMRDLQEAVGVAYRQQEKQATLFRRNLAQEAELLKKKKQVLADLIPLREAVRPFEEEARVDSLSASREQLTGMIDDLNLSLRKGRLKIKAYRKKEKLLSKDIARLKGDYQNALKRQESSESAEEIKEELTRLLSDVDLEDDTAVSRSASAKESRPAVAVSAGQKLEKEIEALQLREAVLTSSLSIIQARYEEEHKAAENFHKEEAQLYEYLKLLRQENRGLQEKVLGLLKAKEKK